MDNQISAILNNSKVANTEKSGNTVFAALLDSNLPPEELSQTRLQHEAIGLIGAGVETTKRALTVASFHILNNPAILTRLREELIAAIPVPENPPPLDVYEKLPYLGACIEEGSAPPQAPVSDPQLLTTLVHMRSPPLILRYHPTHPTRLRQTNGRVQIICPPPGLHRLHVQLLCLPRRKPVPGQFHLQARAVAQRTQSARWQVPLSIHG